jgi:hypothetical protein
MVASTWPVCGVDFADAILGDLSIPAFRLARLSLSCERQAAGTAMFPIAIQIGDWQAEDESYVPVSIAGAGFTGGIFALCIGRFRKKGEIKWQQAKRIW